MRADRWVTAHLLAVLVWVAPASVAARSGGLHGEWMGEVSEINHLLLAERYGKATKRTERLLRDMQGAIRTGGAAWLAKISTLKALASAGEGRVEDGLWFWDVAVAFDPDMEGLDLEPYGEAGRVIRASRPRFDPAEDPEAVEEEASGVNQELAREDPLEVKGDLVPPVKVHAPKPRVPVHFANRGKTVDVIVQVVIGTDGVPRRPRVLLAEGAFIMLYAVFDTLREWRFEPARLGAEPVAVYWNLKVNLKSRSESVPPDDGSE